MKKLCFLALVLSLLGSGVWAATIGNWNRPAANGPGNYTDNSNWANGTGPFTWTSTSTGDEIKMCVEGSIINLSTNAVDPNHTYQFRYSLASGPAIGSTMNILPGANVKFYEFRLGAQGATASGSKGILNQTGGSVSYRDCIIGRGGTSGISPAQGFYTISGGSITYESTNGRLYVGCGNNATPPNYTEGTFTIVGNDASILFRALWVGGNTGNYGHGTVEFRIDPDGVSPINLDTTCNLDIYTADPALSQANLLLSATGDATPAEDIMLVHINNTAEAAAAVNGRFDTLNGGSAAEGTQIILGDNIYKLTYVYVGDSDNKANDIALVHIANFNDLAHDPIPANGSTATTLTSLSWTNPDPNAPGGIITCDVYFGKDPNRPQMDKKTLGAGVSTVAVNSANFPHFVPLSDKTTYYWVVDVHDTSDPNVITGIMWSVFTDINTAPVVDAGPDQVAWLGKSGTPGQEIVTLDATAIDDGYPNPPATMYYTWERISGPATAVINSPNAVDTTVTFTERGTYVFKLTADDNDKETSDTVQVIIGINACDASHLVPGNPEYDPGDQNQDCVVDLADFAALISANWMDCTDTLTNCGL